MHRAIRYGSILGALLLGAGCQSESGAPEESKFIPRPKMISVQEASAKVNTTRVTGFVWDPEAFFTSFVECTQVCKAPIPQLPPLLLDNNPLLLRTVIRGAQVSLVDLEGSAGPLPTVASDPLGIWVQPRVPSRKAPYYARTTGQGALPAEAIFPVLSPLPPVNYLPTVTMRPIHTDVVDGCYGIDAAQLSEKGILQAVAKYLTAKGTSTSATDLTNPARFGGVTVFWLYMPGFSSLRAPGGGTTIEASSGQVLNVEWAPPGVLPPPLSDLQSERGFFVAEGAPVSSVGISVVLLPANSTAPVKYSVKDPQTNAALARPWKAPDITLAPQPSVITFGGIQLWHASGRPFPPEKNFCQAGN